MIWLGYFWGSVRQSAPTLWQSCAAGYFGRRNSGRLFGRFGAFWYLLHCVTAFTCDLFWHLPGL